jgi:hypothetical protein
MVKFVSFGGIPDPDVMAEDSIGNLVALRASFKEFKETLNTNWAHFW